MKKLLTLLLGLSFGTAPMTHAQVTILPDTAYGGQLQIVIQDSISIPDSTTIMWRSEWSSNAAYFPLYPDTFDTTTNVSGGTMTIVASAIRSVPIAGTYHIRIYAIDTTNADTVVGFDHIVVAYPIITIPSISIGTPIPDITGGYIPYSWDGGNDTAWIVKYLNPYDSTDAWFTAFDSVMVIGGTGSSWDTLLNFTTSQHYFAVKYSIRNSVGDTITAKVVVFTSPTGGNPWIDNHPDSVSATTHSVYVSYPVVTNGTNTTARIYCRTSPGGAPIDSVVQSIAGTIGISHATAQFAGLNHTTPYYFQGCVDPGGMCSDEDSVHTHAPAVLLSFSVDTAHATDAVTARIFARDTSVVGGTIQIHVTPANDPAFNYPVSQFTTFVQGVVVTQMDFVNPTFLSTGTGFIPGDTYLVKIDGYNNNIEIATSSVYSFVFMPATTSVIEEVPNIPILVAQSTLIAASEKPTLVQLFTTTGALVLETTLYSGEQLNLTGRVSPGLYMCIWRTGDGLIGNKKMVVE